VKIENIETLKKETELESGVAPDPKGKAKEQNGCSGGCSSHFCSRLACRSADAPAQQISRSSPFCGPRFSTKDMAEGNTSIKRRVTPTKGKRETRMHDEPDGDWPEDLQAKYWSADVQMVLRGPVTQGLEGRCALCLSQDSARVSVPSRVW
jgi:hypothetical protein